MNFKNYFQLNEIEIDSRFESFGNISTKDLKPTLDNIRLSWKKLKEESFKDYKIELYNNKKNYELYVLDLQDNIIGQLVAQKRPFKGLERYPQVYFVFVSKPYQGQGIGYVMHSIMIETLCGIFSDLTLTQGSFNIFKKLMKHYKGYIYNKDTQLVSFQNDSDVLNNKNNLIVILK
jgi:predicted acetyltransferase